MRNILYLTILSIMVSFSASAKEVYYGTAPELVKISQETIFRFHKQVRTISQAQRFEIKPADPNDPDYSVLSIRPRFSKGTSKVAFVLSDGTIATIKLRIVKGRKSSSEPFYDLKPKSMLIDRTEKNLPVITVMDFMKSMDRDDNIVGYKRKVSDSWVSTGLIKGVKAKLIRTYTGKDYKGFVIELKNRYRTKKYKIEADKLKFKGASLAIITLVDSDLLLPKSKGVHKTLLKVVAKPSASIDDLVLPISVVIEKKGGKS
ncbi:MAG: hypothetical protein GY909_17510 [Oligoflexia bacterium]|nr:hypothetical protein [Bacteroidota bacterium]MCP4914920.1 hypothetical protein [Oligoflexia bacterium]